MNRINDESFEGLLNEMREDAPAAGAVEAATERVRRRLETPVCAGFQQAFPGYLEGRLLESRRLLLEDHLGRCAACRRALAEARGEAPEKVVAMPAFGPPAGWRRYSRWAVAAGIAVVALYAGRDRIDSALAPSGPRATVVSVSGRLASLSGSTLAPGASLAEGETVRTGPGSRAALRLRDGSTVEMNERSELLVRAAWSGQRIYLSHGDAIVQAAKQRRGRLQLLTRDATSSVKGTVFAVSTGVAGSLVSVVEGAVEVQQGGADRVLKPGEQMATAAALKSGGVREAIAWSPNAERYYALLAEFAALEPQIAQVTSTLRTQARLLPRLLPDTVVYAAIPNSDGAIDRSVRLITQRVQDNAVMREWWEANPDLRTVLEQLQSASALLGDEIVFALSAEAGAGGRRTPLPAILAEVKTGREAALRETLDKVVVTKARSSYTVVGSLLMISEDAAKLARVQALLGKGASSAFAAEIARRYQRGAGWLLAADIGQMTRWHPAAELAMLNAVGFGQAQYAFVEQRGGRDDNEASLSFAGARQGVASWLATPGAFGSSEYVTGDSILAVAASTRNPRQAFDELMNAIGRVQPKALEHLREFEASSGISVANDIASALGTDFAFSVETASIPMPGWAAAVEVFSPSSLDAAARRLAAEVNKHVPAGQAAHTLVVGEETVAGRRWMWVTDEGKTATLYWTHDRGYTVFGNDRAVVARAISTRASGTPLVRSARFRDRQPVTPSVHNSGFVWMNTRGALQSLMAAAGTSSQGGALQSLLASRDPVLLVFNGETERIAAFSRTRLTSVLVDLLIAGGAGGPAGSGPAGAKTKMELRKRTRANESGD